MNGFRTIRSAEVVSLLLATTINYIDRQTRSVIASPFQKELHISSLRYSYAANSFLIVYAPTHADGPGAG
jgi:hypothetical protein